jgi:2-oxoglutarate ferredoxin oxidoreductase subunit beta
MLKKSFELQLGEGGFCFIELLANCPTNLGMTAVQSIEWMQKKLIPEFTTGVFREPEHN